MTINNKLVVWQYGYKNLTLVRFAKKRKVKAYDCKGDLKFIGESLEDIKQMIDDYYAPIDGFLSTLD